MDKILSFVFLWAAFSFATATTRVIEDDILVDIDASSASAKEPGGQNGTLDKRWPHGVVPFTVSASLPHPERVMEAIEHWETQTNLRFVPRTTSHRNFIEFVRHPKQNCLSYVGMKGGAQSIHLADRCSTGNTIHEIGHAIGLWHEHTRADRDEYVDIFWVNIKPEYQPAFRKNSHDLIGNYDFESIMHYGSFAFAVEKGLATMLTKRGEEIKSQRENLSEEDVFKVGLIYGSEKRGKNLKLLFSP